MLTTEQVAEPLFNFLQMAFAGSAACDQFELTRAAAIRIEARIATGLPLPIKEAMALPDSDRRALRELLMQYVMFLTLFKELTFPADFLLGSDETRLGRNLLEYIHQHQWPFPQQLPW